MSGIKKPASGIRRRSQISINDDLEKHEEALREAGVEENFIQPVLEDLPDLSLAIQLAAFFYEPVHPEIMQKTMVELGIKACVELIEINPEYLSSAFGRDLIRYLRILLYHPNEEIKHLAKDCLARIADSLTQKKRDHFPPGSVAWHWHNIKRVLKQNKDKLSSLQGRLKFLKETFCLEINDENEEPPPFNLAELADYIAAKLYDLTPETVRQYVKKGTIGFDLDRYLMKVRAITQGFDSRPTTQKGELK